MLLGDVSNGVFNGPPRYVASATVSPVSSCICSVNNISRRGSTTHRISAHGVRSFKIFRIPMDVGQVQHFQRWRIILHARSYTIFKNFK